jgi:hypothetical protein
MKSTRAGGEYSKADKPPSSQAERTAPDSLKPSRPKGAQGSPGAGGALTFPTHAAPDQDPVNASLMSRPTESPRAPPPSPQSHGLGAAIWSQRGEGASAPQPTEVP